MNVDDRIEPGAWLAGPASDAGCSAPSERDGRNPAHLLLSTGCRWWHQRPERRWWPGQARRGRAASVDADENNARRGRTGRPSPDPCDGAVDGLFAGLRRSSARRPCASRCDVGGDAHDGLLTMPTAHLLGSPPRVSRWHEGAPIPVPSPRRSRMCRRPRRGLARRAAADPTAAPLATRPTGGAPITGARGPRHRAGARSHARRLRRDGARTSLG